MSIICPHCVALGVATLTELRHYLYWLGTHVLFHLKARKSSSSSAHSCCMRSDARRKCTRHGD